jgi:hypothetical protein
MNFGLGYQISSCWRFGAGYRVVAASGVALAPNQIVTDTFIDIPGVQRVDSNGSLLLHGGYANLEFRF